MLGSFHLFSVRGVPIRIHFTAFLLLPIIHNPRTGIGFTLIFFGLLLLSIGLHELGHTVVSQRYGVNVQDIILTPVGGVARLKGLPDDPHQEIRIALAGPYVSLVLAITGFILTYLFVALGLLVVAGYSFYFAFLNLLMLLFNLLPSFPMDGGRILRGWLSLKKGRLEATRIASTIGKYISIGFIVIGLIYRQVSLAIIGGFILYYGGSEYRLMKLKSWGDLQLGLKPDVDIETDFVASPPPYAKNAKAQKSGRFIDDIILTAKDLVDETKKSLFKL